MCWKSINILSTRMWQDYWFAFAAMAFGAALIPSLLDPKTEVPRFTSIFTGGILVGGICAYLSLGMFWAAAGQILALIPWGIIAIWRPIRG